MAWMMTCQGSAGCQVRDSACTTWRSASQEKLGSLHMPHPARVFALILSGHTGTSSLCLSALRVASQACCFVSRETAGTLLSPRVRSPSFSLAGARSLSRCLSPSCALFLSLARSGLLSRPLCLDRCLRVFSFVLCPRLSSPSTSVLCVSAVVNRGPTVVFARLLSHLAQGWVVRAEWVAWTWLQ